jgi:predicted enzyme related to lactoylglutathione lyase
VEDINAAYDRLRKKGVKFITPPVPVEIGEELLSGVKYSCFYDPDGTILELYGPAPDEA